MGTQEDHLTPYWKTVLDTLQDALMLISEEGIILNVNRAAEKLTGYDREDLIGQPCTILNCTGCEFFGEGPGPQWCQLFTIDKVRHKRCRITANKGRNVHVIKRASVLRDDSGKLLGAVETLSDISDMVRQEWELADLMQRVGEPSGVGELLGESPAMKRVFELIRSAAGSQAPVIILGESGTGKGLAAQAIHDLSDRREKPFVQVNCAALNENILESELFGHVRGAFTGADRHRVGRFESARGGSVFLDEIGDVPLAIQVKILRVLEERLIERVGDNKPVKVEARFITATHKDLHQLIDDGLFREDLYYRISVVPIKIPALRERTEDLPLLTQAFIDRLAKETGKPIKGYTREAMERLVTYTWPGNVRELRNAVEYAFVVCQDDRIDLGHLPDRILAEPAPESRSIGRSNGRDELLRALREAGGNQSQAARILGVSRMTIWNRMKKYGISIDRDIK